MAEEKKSMHVQFQDRIEVVREKAIEEMTETIKREVRERYEQEAAESLRHRY